MHVWRLLQGVGQSYTHFKCTPVCACICCCCSCRLWLSTEMPLSLCSFSPSGDGVWLTAQLFDPCLFCLQLFHLQHANRAEESRTFLLSFLGKYNHKNSLLGNSRWIFLHRKTSPSNPESSVVQLFYHV